MLFKESSRGIKVIIPNIPKGASAAAKTCYDSSFVVKAGMLWNTLPKAVNTQGTLEGFKSSLGQFLDTIPENPPPRYTQRKTGTL